MNSLHKLSEVEINELVSQIHNQKVFADVIEFVKENYPKNAEYFTIETENEYNDETYDYCISELNVFGPDKTKLERLPEIDEDEYSDGFYNIRNLKSNVGDNYDENTGKNTVQLNFKIPTLYSNE